MKCIKCGKDTVSGAVFCAECLADMDQHPVKPGTPLILPKRDEQPLTKHGRKKTVKPEVQVIHLKKALRWMLGIIAVLLLLVAAAAIIIFQLLNGDPAPLFN